MSEQNDAETQPAAPAGKGKIVALLLVVNTLLLAGVLIFVMKRPAAQAAAPAAAAAEHGEKGEGGKGAHGPDLGGLGPTIRFDNFIVQLRSLDVDRYAHMSIEIEIADDATKAALEKRVPLIRDAVLSYLADRTAEELRGSEGLSQMKAAILKKLHELIPGNKIRNLFITDFITQ